MKFYPKLYVGPTVKSISSIKLKLKLGIGTLQVYIISLSNTMDQLDIFHAGLLKQKYLRKQPLYIVGIANGREEAIQLVLKMTQDVLDQNGTANIKQYFLDMM